MYVETGEKIEEEESRLLGKMLQMIDIDLDRYGVDIQQLLNGSTELSCEEMQLILSEFPSTRMLSKNLKQELSTSELFILYSNVKIFLGNMPLDPPRRKQIPPTNRPLTAHSHRIAPPNAIWVSVAYYI